MIALVGWVASGLGVSPIFGVGATCPEASVEQKLQDPMQDCNKILLLGKHFSFLWDSFSLTGRSGRWPEENLMDVYLQVYCNPKDDDGKKSITVSLGGVKPSMIGSS